MQGLGWGWVQTGTGSISRIVNIQCLNFSFSKLTSEQKVVFSATKNQDTNPQHTLRLLFNDFHILPNIYRQCNHCKTKMVSPLWKFVWFLFYFSLKAKTMQLFNFNITASCV